jgi:hypothetical protein
MKERSKKSHALELLVELREIYREEGGRNFISGITAAIGSLSDEELSEEERWDNECSIYRTMAGFKSGFADLYIDRETVEQRIDANARLDHIRQELWTLFGY